MSFHPNPVEDVLEGTVFEGYAAKYSFGLHVVRGAMMEPAAEGIRRKVEKDIECLEHTKSKASITSKAKKGPTYYRTVQATTGVCTCKYAYETTAKHILQNVAKMSGLKEATDWLQSTCSSKRGRAAEQLHQIMFNEIVANEYSIAKDEQISWHTDSNALLAESTNVLSLSMGSAAVFCYKLNEKTSALEHLGITRKKKFTDRVNIVTEKGLKGFVPLFNGDLLLMTGTFQKYLVHKTQKFSVREEDVRRKYPGACENSLRLLPLALIQKDKHRACITWRRIAHHKHGCPELFQEEVPADDADDLTMMLHDLTIRQEAVAERARIDVPASSSPKEVIDFVTPGPDDSATELDNIPHESVLDRLALTRTWIERLEKFMLEQKFTLALLDQTDWQDEESVAVADERAALEKSTVRVSNVLRRVLGERYRQMAVTENSEIAVDAYQRLKTFEGSHSAILVTESEKRARPFETGAMGKKFSVALRVLTSLDNAVKFIRSANISHARTSQGQVNYDDGRKSTGMFMLIKGNPQNAQVFWNARFKVFELALNYQEPGKKYSMQALSVRDLTTRDAQGERYKRFHNLLVDVIVAEKRRQMNSADRNSAPFGTLPWSVVDVWTMPIVLWMYKEEFLDVHD
jgi:hypothetical protein